MITSKGCENGQRMRKISKVFGLTVDNYNRGYFPLTNMGKICYNRNERPMGDIYNEFGKEKYC